VTEIEPERTYALRDTARHAIEENFRVESFRALLSACNEAPLAPTVYSLLGELLLQSHASYSRIGLGSIGTDDLVNLVQSSMLLDEFYGAKITGGGSGGTVCVMGKASSESAVLAICDAYQEKNGHRPYVFRGSSPGAMSFGHMKIRLQ